jgi:environmental stress-induced protein Ves
MIWRMSVATVAEDGPFSRFPGIWRSLTVIDGPGFRLAGDGVDLLAAPLCPVSFDGGAAVSACDVTGISRDFNVMVAAPLPPPQVWVGRGGARLDRGAAVAVYALDPMAADGHAVAAGGLVLAEEPPEVSGGSWIGVVLPGL